MRPIENEDEFTKTELVDLAKTLEIEVKSKDTKAKLIVKINEAIEALAMPQLVDVDSDYCDSPETVDVVEEPVVDVTFKNGSKIVLKVHKGFHPITGKLVD